MFEAAGVDTESLTVCWWPAGLARRCCTCSVPTHRAATSQCRTTRPRTTPRTPWRRCQAVSSPSSTPVTRIPARACWPLSQGWAVPPRSHGRTSRVTSGSGARGTVSWSSTPRVHVRRGAREGSCASRPAYALRLGLGRPRRGRGWRRVERRGHRLRHGHPAHGPHRHSDDLVRATRRGTTGCGPRRLRVARTPSTLTRSVGWGDLDERNTSGGMPVPPLKRACKRSPLLGSRVPRWTGGVRRRKCQPRGIRSDDGRHRSQQCSVEGARPNRRAAVRASRRQP